MVVKVLHVGYARKTIKLDGESLLVFYGRGVNAGLISCDFPSHRILRVHLVLLKYHFIWCGLFLKAAA